MGCLCTCARAHFLRMMVPPRPLVHRRSRRHTGLITVHTTSTKALICPRPFPQGTHLGKTCSIECDVLPRPSLAHMFLWISTDGALDGTFHLIDALFLRHQLLRSVLQSGVSLILTRALERGLRIPPSRGGGHIMPPSISAPMRAAATNFGGYLGPH